MKQKRCKRALAFTKTILGELWKTETHGQKTRGQGACQIHLFQCFQKSAMLGCQKESRFTFTLRKDSEEIKHCKGKIQVFFQWHRLGDPTLTVAKRGFLCFVTEKYRVHSALDQAESKRSDNVFRKMTTSELLSSTSDLL